MSHDYSRSRSSAPFYTNIPWLWVGILIAIVALIYIARSFSTDTIPHTDRPYIMITPDTSASAVFIAMTESSKNRITGTGGQSLYVGDKSVSVEAGSAHGENDNLSLDIDEKTEFIYTAHTSTGDTLDLKKGRIWLNQIKNTTQINLKNLSVSIAGGNVVLLEQSNQIYSTIYAIVGNVAVSTRIGGYELKAGSRMMISASDMASPSADISKLVGPIEEDIFDNPLFIKNDGKKLLSSSMIGGSGSNIGSSGVMATGAISASMITFIEPLDGSISNEPTLTIRGSINSNIVKRVTLNDIDTVISPVNNTFTLKDFGLTGEVNNIVYKVYSTENSLIEKGVITVFGSKQASQSINKLITNNSPISSKDFKISYPTSNPFIMTDRAIKVQGTVPKDTVSSITVNDYKLQKYIAGSTSWYYFANMESSTLRDGINLYTIKFFGTDNTLLYTQLFTIIKESKNATLSGESSR